MLIRQVKIKDFFVLKGEFTIDFCAGMNVFIGGNGTGKTTLLRGLYRHESASSFDVLISGKSANVIYISESNILSHARGLLETVKHGGLNYDYHEVAVIEQARVLPSKPKPPIVERIEAVIGGSIELSADGQSFVVAKPSLTKPIDLLYEASGYQKFALLARLIHNGQIANGSIMLWDEPENSLNPELVPVLVDILLELAKDGVQIFLATHDYNLVRHFDVREDKSTLVMYHNLSKLENGQIKCESSLEYMALPNNLLEKANEDLFEAVMKAANE